MGIHMRVLMPPTPRNKYISSWRQSWLSLTRQGRNKKHCHSRSTEAPPSGQLGKAGWGFDICNFPQFRHSPPKVCDTPGKGALAAVQCTEQCLRDAGAALRSGRARRAPHADVLLYEALSLCWDRAGDLDAAVWSAAVHAVAKFIDVLPGTPTT